MTLRDRIERGLYAIGGAGIAGLGCLLGALMLHLTWTIPAAERIEQARFEIATAERRQSAQRLQAGAPADLAGFAAVFPGANARNSRLRALNALAERNGVTLEQATYKSPQPAAGEVLELQAQANGRSNYAGLRALLQALTTGEDPLSVDAIQFSRQANASGGAGDALEFKLRLSFFER